MQKQPPPPCSILILAAGSASRMRGGDKTMEQVDGLPLVARQAQVALATGRPVIVALPPDRPARNAALAGLALRIVTVADAGTGMAASIRAGLAGLPPDAALLLLLADLPEITTGDLLALLDAHSDDPGAILRATDTDGLPGHPVLFPTWAVPALAQVQGDSGARDLLRAHADRIRFIPLPGHHATTDLDTPDEWALWRARQALSGGSSPA